MGMDKQTDGQTEGWTNGQTDKWKNIYSIFRDKLSLPEGSLDMHSDRHLYGRTTQLLAQIEKLWRQRLCSSLEHIFKS
jgi:hypothetical protein